MSWQQAPQDKGCKSKSQGTKEEKLLKRQAPAPRRDREAQEAGGTMNVEKTGKGGLPTDLEQPWLDKAGAGGEAPVASELSPHTSSFSPGRDCLNVAFREPSLPIPSLGRPPRSATGAPRSDQRLRLARAGVEFLRFLSSPQCLANAG